MLVLERKPLERVYLEYAGIQIEVQVVGMTGQRVWLGFSAPQEVRIHRGQAARRAKSEGQRAKR